MLKETLATTIVWWCGMGLLLSAFIALMIAGVQGVRADRQREREAIERKRRTHRRAASILLKP